MNQKTRFASGHIPVIAKIIFLAFAFAASNLAWAQLQFLYVANFASNNVTGFVVNPLTGALTTISGSPFSAGEFGGNEIVGTS